MNKTNLSTNDEEKQVALFRYSLIAPLVINCHTCKSKMMYFRDIASKKHKLPSGKEVYISFNTIKGWYRQYTKDGFDALIPKIRSDIGKSRKLNDSTIEKVYELKEKFPHITGKIIYKKLIEEGYIDKERISLATLYRFIKANTIKHTANKECKAFEMECSNDCWQRRYKSRSSYNNRR